MTDFTVWELRSDWGLGGSAGEQRRSFYADRDLALEAVEQEKLYIESLQSPHYPVGQWDLGAGDRWRTEHGGCSVSIQEHTVRASSD